MNQIIIDTQKMSDGKTYVGIEQHKDFNFSKINTFFEHSKLVKNEWDKVSERIAVSML